MTGDAPETVITGVHEEQLEVAVTWMLPVPPAAPTLALSGFRLKVQGRAAPTVSRTGVESNPLTEVGEFTEISPA